MPVKIACPKCSKSYTLPDSALGKAVKCKACGTAFRTRKPDATSQPAPAKPAARPAKPSARPTPAKPAQPVSPDPSQFGVEGGFQKQADIFGAPPSPRGGAGLDNFAEDGFGEAVAPIVLGPQGGPPQVVENPYQSVMTNTAIKKNRSKSGGRKRKKGSSGASFDPDRYKVARVGMMILLLSGGIFLMASVFSNVVGLFASQLPEMAKNLGPAIGIVMLIMGLLCLLALMGFFVGQLLCVFAPESNEKMNAGGSLGLFFLSFFVGVIGFLVLGASMNNILRANNFDAGPSVTQTATLGIGMLVVTVIVGLMGLVSTILFANYYRVIGKNIKSKKLASAGTQGLAAIGLGIGGQVVIFLIAFVLGMAIKDLGTLQLVTGGLTLFNFLLGIVVFVIMLRMVMTGASVLKG